MFRGVTKLALDNKGRFAIPAKYRDTVQASCGGKMVLTADPSRCLLLYPLPQWEPMQLKLMSLPSFDQKIRRLQRLLVGYADDVELDAAGRILVSSALRDYARLEKDVALVGQGDRFEVWNDSDWESLQPSRDPLAPNFTEQDLPSELRGFSL